jgi:hypothetical protein
MNTPLKMAPHRAFEVVRIPSMSWLRNGGTRSGPVGVVVDVVVMHLELATDAPVESRAHETTAITAYKK